MSLHIATEPVFLDDLSHPERVAIVDLPTCPLQEEERVGVRYHRNSPLFSKTIPVIFTGMQDQVTHLNRGSVVKWLNALPDLGAPIPPDSPNEDIVEHINRLLAIYKQEQIRLDIGLGLNYYNCILYPFQLRKALEQIEGLSERVHRCGLCCYKQTYQLQLAYWLELKADQILPYQSLPEICTELTRCLLPLAPSLKCELDALSQQYLYPPKLEVFDYGLLPEEEAANPNFLVLERIPGKL